MEQKARLLKQNIDYLHGGSKPDRIIATGGGAKSDLWSQIKADMMNVEVLASACEEPACLGAATFAALSQRWYPDYRAIVRDWISIRRRFQPRPEFHQKYRRLTTAG